MILIFDKQREGRKREKSKDPHGHNTKFGKDLQSKMIVTCEDTLTEGKRVPMRRRIKFQMGMGNLG